MASDRPELDAGPGDSRTGAPKLLRLVRAIDVIYQALLKGACTLLFIAMILLVGAQIIMRYLFNQPLIWSEELARFAMIYLAFLASALAIRLNQHIRVTGLFRLPPHWARTIAVVSTLVTAAALSIITWQGWLITGKVARQTSTALAVTMDHIYLAIPLGGALMLLGLVLSLLLDRLPSEDLEAALPVKD